MEYTEPAINRKLREVPVLKVRECLQFIPFRDANRKVGGESSPRLRDMVRAYHSCWKDGTFLDPENKERLFMAAVSAQVVLHHRSRIYGRDIYPRCVEGKTNV